VAALDPLFPVWAIAADDATLPTLVEAATRARAAGATLIASGSAAARVGADYLLPTPRAGSPLVGPLLSVVPGQLFAWALARTKGLDPDEPRGLSKVTLAR
jgi:glucosamine--fructose-6-phosphate aminotransferase (isomerizing)